MDLAAAVALVDERHVAEALRDAAVDSWNQRQSPIGLNDATVAALEQRRFRL